MTTHHGQDWRGAARPPDDPCRPACLAELLLSRHQQAAAERACQERTAGHATAAERAQGESQRAQRQLDLALEVRTLLTDPLNSAAQMGYCAEFSAPAGETCSDGLFLPNEVWTVIRKLCWQVQPFMLPQESFPRTWATAFPSCAHVNVGSDPPSAAAPPPVRGCCAGHGNRAG